MKNLLFLSLFALALSACEMPAEENPGDAGATVPTQEEPLPVITLSANGSELSVITGSSCYGTMCIDKIAPWELLGEMGETYESVESRTLTLKSDTEIDSALFDLMDENGGGLSCEIESEKVDGMTYTLTLCEEELGETLLHMGLNFEKGSVEYYAALSL